MSIDVLTFEKRSLLGTECPSVLRIYELANGISTKSPVRQERTRAVKAIQRILNELRKRILPP